MLPSKIQVLAHALSVKIGEQAWDDEHANEVAVNPLIGFDVLAYQDAIAERVKPDLLETLETAYLHGYHDCVESLNAPRPTVTGEHSLTNIVVADQRRIDRFASIDLVLGALLIAALVGIATGPIGIMRPVMICIMALAAARLIYGVYGLRR